MWVSGQRPSPTPPVPGVGSSWGVGPGDAASGRASWTSGWPSQPLVGFVSLGSRWGSVGSGCAELSHEDAPSVPVGVTCELCLLGLLTRPVGSAGVSVESPRNRSCAREGHCSG